MEESLHKPMNIITRIFEIKCKQLWRCRKQIYIFPYFFENPGYDVHGVMRINWGKAAGTCVDNLKSLRKIPSRKNLFRNTGTSGTGFSR
jgi:hypothetical protein